MRPVFPLTNTYTNLPEHFYKHQHPTPVQHPRLMVINSALAASLNIDLAKLSLEQQAAVFSGNLIPEGAQPIALAYAGHQFGNFVPQLGDGRAILLGELVDTHGHRYDMQLKGAGQTPFSRRGDGRAALGPMLREYLISEAMHALRIPTTRALAVVTTGETVLRDEPLAGAILTRIAASHIRVGTFQYFAAKGDIEALQTLTHYAINRHYPEATTPLEFLKQVIARQAQLIAQWLCVGFIHGVMNTDNMTISGETIDYGPCAFMDAYDPQTVFSSIDHHGRYAFANQPSIAHWNLTRLAECLIPLLDKEPDAAIKSAEHALNQFSHTFETAWHTGMRRKLGLLSAQQGDALLIGDLLQLMQRTNADFTNTFRALYNHAINPETIATPLGTGAAATDWLNRWKVRFIAEGTSPAERLETMRCANPAFIPRNHRVEYALQEAYQGNLEPFEVLHKILTTPYDDQPQYQEYTKRPKPSARVYQTFCGT